MAARFWVGGAGTWDNTNTTNWSATSNGAGGASAPTSADDVTFDASSGTGIVTTAATAAANSITYNSSTLTSLTLGAGLDISGSTSGAITLTAGTINLAGFTLTSKTFSSSNSNTRAIQFGSGNITVTSSGTVWTTATATGLTYTGTPTVNISNNSATATTVSAGNISGASTNAFNFNFTTGTYTLTISTGSIVGALNFTGFTGTWAPSTATCTFYGSLTLVSGMTFTTGSGVWTWANTSGTAVITSASKTLFSITQSGLGGTVQLAAGTTTLSTSAQYTLNSGTLDLGTNTATLSCGLFSSSGSSSRAVAFGTGNITLAGSSTSWTTTVATNLTYTGTPTVNITGSSVATITAGTTGGASTNAFNFYVSAGTTFSLTTGSAVGSLNFTGFTGTWAPSTATCTFYGSLTLVSGMTFTTGSGLWTIAGSDNKTLTSAGKSLFSITQSGTGILTLASSTTLSTTATYTLTQGTLDLATNTATLSCGIFNTSSSSSRSISFGSGGQITLTGSSTTIWNEATATLFTYTGTPKIVATYSGSVGTRSITFGTQASPFTVGAGSGNQFSFGTAGTDSVQIGGNVISLDFTGFTGTWAQGSFAATITTGNLTLVSGMTCTPSTGVTTFTATSGTQVITSAGKTMNPVTQNGAGGTVQLADTLTLATTGTYTLTAGTLDLATNTATLSCGLFSSSNTNTRVIAFGSGNITTTGSGTAWTTATATNLTYTGTSTVNISNNSATATTVTAGTTGGAATNAFNFNFTTGTYALTLTTASVFRTLNFTGFGGTWSPSTATATFYGDVDIPGSGNFTAGTGVWTLAATSGTQIIGGGGATINPITQNGFGGTVRIGTGAATTINGTYTLTNGTLDIGTNTATLNCTAFSSTNGNTRQIQFGTGNITTTGSGTAFNMSNVAGFTYTGTPTVNISNSGSTATTVNTHITGNSPSESNVLNFNITTGSYTFTLSSQSNIKSLNFTGFTGTWAPSTATAIIYGNLTLVSGMTYTTGSGAWTFAATSGTQIITSAGKTLGPITINNTGTSVKLGDNMTSSGAFTFTTGTLDINSVTTSVGGTVTFATGPSTIINGTLNCTSVTHTSGTVNLSATGPGLISTGTYTHTAGTLNLANQTLTAGSYSSNNSNTRSITFGTGQITLTANGGTIWNTSTDTNWNYTGTVKIVSTGSGSPTIRSFSFGTGNTVFTVGSGSGNQVSFGNPASDSIQFSGNMVSLDFTGYTGTWSQNISNISITTGNLTLVSGMSTSPGLDVISFTATSGTQTITSAGKTINAVTQNGAGGTVRLADNLNIYGLYTLTAGSLDLATNNAILSVDGFSSNNSNTRDIKFGTSSITIVNNSYGNTTVWNTSTITGLTYTGTPTVNVSTNRSQATTVNANVTGGTSSNVFNFNFTTGTYTLTLTSGSVLKAVDFTGFTGTWGQSTNSLTLLGNLKLVSGMTTTTGAGSLTFGGSGTQTVTSAGKDLNPITVNMNTGTDVLRFLDNVSSPVGTFSMTQGIIDIGTNSVSLTCNAFSRSGTFTSAIQFGTGVINISGTTGWSMTSGANFTYTGTPTINLTHNTTSTVSVTTHTTGYTQSNVLNFNIPSTASFRLSLGNNSRFNSLTMANGYSGTISTTTTNNTCLIYIYGDLTFSGSSTASVSAGGASSSAYDVNWILFSTGGTQNITSNGFTGSGYILMLLGTSTVNLQDDLNITNCNLATNNRLDVYAAGMTFNTNNHNVKVGTARIIYGTCYMGSGTWELTGTGTVWDYYGVANATLYPQTSTIKLSGGVSSADLIQFNGSDLSTYYNLEIAGSSSVACKFYITQSNGFNRISSTKGGTWTLQFDTAQTNTFANWDLGSSTTTDYITVQTSTAGTRATIAKSGGGAVNVYRMSFQDITGSPGSTWYASTANGNTDLGNNSQIIFAPSSSNMFLLF